MQTEIYDLIQNRKIWEQGKELPVSPHHFLKVNFLQKNSN